MKQLKKLLEKVSNIIEIDKKIQEERRKRGEKFNVFNVLGLWSDEVRLHSAFLAELFNPNGNHGLGYIFLKEFVSMLEIKNFNFYAENCIVHKEKHIGKVTDKEGGRIDILLIDKDNNAIIIENKIYASDGEN